MPCFIPDDAPDITQFYCPKWDVDAICAAALLVDIEYAVYMGTGSEQHFMHWGEGLDKKLKERVELVRKLDTGELGTHLGEHPQLTGLARGGGGFTTVIQISADWTFPSGKWGRSLP